MFYRLVFFGCLGRFAVRYVAAAVAVAAGLFEMSAFGASGLAPLTSFAGGDGWLVPGERTYLTTDNTQRGLAYNPSTGHLLLVNRAGGLSINILDSATGDDLSTLNQGSGVISGGLFLGNMIDVADDGAIYMANLCLDTNTQNFKIYRWENETAMPTVAYANTVGLPLAGSRIGDSFDVIGSGANTKFVGGYFQNPAVAGNNSYAVLETTDGLNFSATHVDIPGSPPVAGDFRLGITFTDSSHVLGSQGNSLYRYTSYTGGTGTLIASPNIPDPAGATADRLLGYTVLNGNPLLAVQSTGDAHVSVYSVADPATPLWLGSGRNITGTAPTNGTAANANATGDLAWGAVTNNPDGSVSQTLYGLSTNSGIQAFTFTLDVPPLIPGDYNKDGIVDGGDYVIWLKSLNRAAVPAGTGADGSANGTVAPEDYEFWRARYGNTSGSGASVSGAIPEPSAIVLAVLVMVYGIGQRGRRWMKAL